MNDFFHKHAHINATAIAAIKWAIVIVPIDTTNNCYTTELKGILYFEGHI